MVVSWRIPQKMQMASDPRLVQHEAVHLRVFKQLGSEFQAKVTDISIDALP